MNTKTLKMKLFPLPEFLFKIGLALIAFLTPIAPVLVAVSILIIADAVTGILASRVKKIPFSSSRFFSSITKLLMYLFLILISHMVELHLVPIIPLVQLSIYFICFYEFSSFLENIGTITGRNPFIFFKEALNKLKPDSKKDS